MASEVPHTDLIPDSVSATQTNPQPAPATKPSLNSEDTVTSSSSLGDELGSELSPMRTHEQSGHSSSIADKFASLVGESDDEDQAVDVNKVDHDALKRKELTRQKTSEGGKANKLRDRLKRTVSKTA